MGAGRHVHAAKKLGAAVLLRDDGRHAVCSDNMSSRHHLYRYGRARAHLEALIRQFALNCHPLRDPFGFFNGSVGVHKICDEVRLALRHAVELLQWRRANKVQAKRLMSEREEAEIWRRCWGQCGCWRWYRCWGRCGCGWLCGRECWG